MRNTGIIKKITGIIKNGIKETGIKTGIIKTGIITGIIQEQRNWVNTEIKDNTGKNWDNTNKKKR